ncbi:MAG: pyridoxal phosphate-dependent aminotransferase [Lachnospiraceae bacterium]|jgi:aspartate aminotransferase|nr:pyridoxal phosphate-dependent aminotransferase [Lachnospiraceae bacterium]
MSLELSSKAKKVKPSSTLAITAKAKAMKAEGIDVVGFGAGEPDFDTPQYIKDAAIKAINEGFTKYTTASGTDELKKAVCEKELAYNHLQYAPNQVVISNGGKHSLTNIFEAILNPEDEVIIPIPYWLTYPEIVKLADGVPVFIEGKKENGYKITASELEAAITDKTKALILNTPSNPTGMIYSKEELEDIAEVVVRKDIYVVADEMYEYLVYEGNEHVSIASLGDEIYKRTITCSGLSKSYAMTGWRIGYACADAAIAKIMGSVQSHQTSNPNSIAQKAAFAAITGPQDSLYSMKDEFDKRRVYMYDRIKAMPLVDCAKPLGAFYCFIDFSNVIGKKYKGEVIDSAARVAEILIQDYSVAVVPCADFGSPANIRLSYAISIPTIEKGLDRIEEFLGILE